MLRSDRRGCDAMRCFLLQSPPQMASQSVARSRDILPLAEEGVREEWGSWDAEGSSAAGVDQVADLHLAG